MVMEPVSVEEAIEKAKKKGLRPGRVKGTDGIQFTKGRNNRIEVITWDEFRSTLSDRQLEVFDSNGFMKIMKRHRCAADLATCVRSVSGASAVRTHLPV